ncbi:MAG TPA: 2-phospho-L-lactate guanylyltransferase [Trebonia sp.]|jgi:2-phospho-L-lactate guanylyltransferase|nr:2-phospho-L-lactate guanylyltransferase [Trebonia sp.]
MTESALFAWTVVMPVKVLAQAKSRLALLAGPRRPSLALAFASDTVSAVLSCPDVARLLVVTSDTVAERRLSALGAVVVPDSPGAGLNEALSYGALVASRRWPGAGIAALTADLPALRPAELSRALRAAGTAAAAGNAASFVPDAAGVGTTMYAVAPWGTFCPQYGGPSRKRHAITGALELSLDGIAGLRRDVDTPEDLRAALALGTGFRTTALAGELPDGNIAGG